MSNLIQYRVVFWWVHIGKCTGLKIQIEYEDSIGWVPVRDDAFRDGSYAQSWFMVAMSAGDIPMVQHHQYVDNY